MILFMKMSKFLMILFETIYQNTSWESEKFWHHIFIRILYFSFDTHYANMRIWEKRLIWLCKKLKIENHHYNTWTNCISKKGRFFFYPYYLYIFQNLSAEKLKNNKILRLGRCKYTLKYIRYYYQAQRGGGGSWGL